MKTEKIKGQIWGFHPFNEGQKGDFTPLEKKEKRKKKGPIGTRISLVSYWPPCPSSSFFPFSLGREPWSVAVQALSECTRRTSELLVLLNLDAHDLALRRWLTGPEWHAWAHGLVSFWCVFPAAIYILQQPTTAGYWAQALLQHHAHLERWNATFLVTQTCSIGLFLDFFGPNGALF